MTTQIKLGNLTIHRVLESQAPMFPVAEFFPTLAKEVLEENRSWLEPTYFDPPPARSCSPSRASSCKRRTTTSWSTPASAITSRGRCGRWDMLESDRWEKGLAATGLGVDDIDFVMCTHLHVDHVGWNTRLENGRWVPTFPKARYLFADRELAFWTQKDKDDAASWPWIGDSVLPIVEAKRADIVKSDHALNDPVQLIPTPGHTIDHFSVQVGKAGRGCGHHRRHDPLADPGPLSRARHARRLRFQARRPIAAQASSAASATPRP